MALLLLRVIIIIIIIIGIIINGCTAHLLGFNLDYMHNW
jgi:hypothetical protein